MSIGEWWGWAQDQWAQYWDVDDDRTTDRLDQQLSSRAQKEDDLETQNGNAAAAADEQGGVAPDVPFDVREEPEENGEGVGVVGGEEEPVLVSFSETSFFAEGHSYDRLSAIDVVETLEIDNEDYPRIDIRDDLVLVPLKDLEMKPHELAVASYRSDVTNDVSPNQIMRLMKRCRKRGSRYLAIDIVSIDHGAGEEVLAQSLLQFSKLFSDENVAVVTAFGLDQKTVEDTLQRVWIQSEVVDFCDRVSLRLMFPKIAEWIIERRRPNWDDLFELIVLKRLSLFLASCRMEIDPPFAYFFWFWVSFAVHRIVLVFYVIVLTPIAFVASLICILTLVILYPTFVISDLIGILCYQKLEERVTQKLFDLLAWSPQAIIQTFLFVVPNFVAWPLFKLAIHQILASGRVSMDNVNLLHSLLKTEKPCQHVGDILHIVAKNMLLHHPESLDDPFREEFIHSTFGVTLGQGRVSCHICRFHTALILGLVGNNGRGPLTNFVDLGFFVTNESGFKMCNALLLDLRHDTVERAPREYMTKLHGIGLNGLQLITNFETIDVHMETYNPSGISLLDTFGVGLILRGFTALRNATNMKDCVHVTINLHQSKKHAVLLKHYLHIMKTSLHQLKICKHEI